MRIIISLFLLLIALEIKASQSAIVRSTRAVVYADIYMKSPIGYLSRGKKIIVGEKKRLNDKVIPTIIDRKVVWMKVDDLVLENEKEFLIQNKTVKEHVAFIQEEELEAENNDSFFENNYLRFKYGVTTPSVTQGDEGVGSGYSLTSETLTGYEISAYLEHRHPFKRWNWGFGFSYQNFSSQVVEYEFPNIMIGGGYVFFKSGLVNLELISNFLFSLDLRVESPGLGQYQGSAYGAEIGPLLRLRPYKKIGLVLSALMKRSRFINLRTVENQFSDRKDHLSGFSDFALYGGLVIGI